MHFRPVSHAIIVLAAAVGVLASLATAMAEPRHGLSTFGDLKYKPAFAHFDYVDPSAPKGGRLVTMSTAALDTFDSFNPFILKGDPAAGIQELTFDSLMTRAADERDAMYGLVAETVDIADDHLSATFRLRKEARFADSSPITADDCAFSFRILKDKGHPATAIVLRDVTGAEAVDPLTVRYTFTGTEVRDLPAIVAALPILSKAYYTANPFDELSLIAPLGSGPYRVGAFEQGKYVTYERRADYWGRELPVNRGRYNFDEVRYEYFRTRPASLEALKSGILDVREEFTSKDWALSYDIPAVKDKRLRRETLPDATPAGTQGFWINTRRPKLADPRVRHALDATFDFEWANKNLFYNLYKRTVSFFENSDLAASGVPSQAELALLAPLRSQVPASVFGEAYVPPKRAVTDGKDRHAMSVAGKLLQEAGYLLKDGRRLTPTGEQLTIEFLTSDQSDDRFLGQYFESLRALGIDVSLRVVDSAQYQRRVKEFDYDMIGARFQMPITPGRELVTLFGSEAAATIGSSNLAGVKDPAVDALIDKIVSARSRVELETAGRALDRVLRAGHYWVPNWHKAVHNIVFWDKFGWPSVPPRYGSGIIDTWWYDAAKAAKLASN